MPNFKKKPLVISAEQWWPGKMIDGVVSDYSKCNHGTERERELPHVHTLEGPLLVSPGDWIITGVKGEKYPCKDDVFRATYDEVPPSCLGYSGCDGMDHDERCPVATSVTGRLDQRL